MTEAQRLQIRSSEIREKLNALAGVEDLDDTQRQEIDALTTEYRDVEVRMRAALTAEGEPETTTTTTDTEHRERLSLLGRARLGEWVRAAVRGVPPSGVEAETAAAFGCPGGVPLEAFEGEHRQGVEHRDVTAAPSTDTATNVATIMPAVFDRSAAAYLGVEMPTVAAGTASYPVITKSVTAGARAKSAEGPETAGVISPYTVTPRRITGSFRITREDEAMLEGLESALRENLGDVLSDQVDRQVIAGDNNAPNLNGLHTQLDAATDPAADAETFDRYVAAVAGHVDGLFANTLRDLRVLVGAETYRHSASTFRGTDGETSAQAYVAGMTGGWRASRRIPEPSTNVQTAIVRRSAVGGRVAVAPVWQGVELIRDPFTNAGKGETKLTVLLLMGGVAILRPAAFAQDSFRLAA